MKNTKITSILLMGFCFFSFLNGNASDIPHLKKNYNSMETKLRLIQQLYIVQEFRLIQAIRS